MGEEDSTHDSRGCDTVAPRGPGIRISGRKRCTEIGRPIRSIWRRSRHCKVPTRVERLAARNCPCNSGRWWNYTGSREIGNEKRAYVNLLPAFHFLLIRTSLLNSRIVTPDEWSITITCFYSLSVEEISHSSSRNLRGQFWIKLENLPSFQFE